MTIKVQLDKGEKGLHIWEHSDRKSAMRRANALVEVHGQFITDLYDEGNTIIVDASRFYTVKKPNENRKTKHFMLDASKDDANLNEVIHRYAAKEILSCNGVESFASTWSRRIELRLKREAEGYDTGNFVY